MPRTSARQAGLARRQQGIQTFARATKPGFTTRQSLGDGKKEHLVPSTTINLPVSPSKKRKLNELENVECGGGAREQGAGKSEAQTTLTPSKSLKFSTLSVSTPRRSGHYASSRSRTAVNDNSNTITNNDDRHDDIPTTPSKRSATGLRRPRRESRPEPMVVFATRSPCVEDMVGLHLAVLKALTIHAAHQGPSAPAELKEFLHSVERLWKKRKVLVKDLQRLVWIWQQGGESSLMFSFRLANYGLGRVCLERIAGRAERVDEVALQTQFESVVDLLWEKALDSVQGDESRVDFLANLGLASIHESLTPFTVFRKGQQRLQDLRGGVIKVKMEQFRAEALGDSSDAKPRDGTANRRLGLLDRIKNKQLRQSKLPPPPSKGMLLRRAAAERIEEVAGVLSMLRPVGYVGSGPTARMTVQRTPFCLETIVQNVQNSARNPISEKEVEFCLEILSRDDVAGHWVSIVSVNQLKSIVLKSCGDVQPKDIAAKVSQLKIGWEESTCASSQPSSN